MPKIQILPEEIRGKIAAGEVIERPASVLKELFENALDAGATFLKIEFLKGGLEKIAVYDNGEGMGAQDLKLCYLPFATSKIRQVTDLFSLRTYGFRGEALSSIAQVSRLRIISRERGEALAYEIQIEFGRERSFKPLPFKEGTLVEVCDLFENLPARRAFLKNYKIESAKNLELIRSLALTHPEIGLQVKVDEKEVIHWKGGSLEDLLTYLYEIPREFLYSSYFERDQYRVHLILTNTQKTFNHRRYLFFLVNRRLIRDEKLGRFIISILKKYYGALGFPAGVISLFVMPHLVDFNVHPAKWEVRFKREEEIYSFLKSAFEEHFLQKRKTFFGWKESPSKDTFIVKEDLPLDYSSNASKEVPLKKEIPLSFSDELKFKVLGTFLNTYILVEKEEDLYIIDQHALSERIHYEKLKNQDFRTYSQRLILPFLVRLTPEMLENIEKKLEILEMLGFNLELISERELIVKALPLDLEESAKAFLERILSLPEIEPLEARESLLKELACNLARKKGDPLVAEEKEFLVSKMFKDHLETCPHGRPLFIKLPLIEIEKRLKRRP